MSYDINEHNYSPIPDNFALASSEIHGIGFFFLPSESSKNLMLYKDQVLSFPVGRLVPDAHLYDCGIVRTNGGGFINHSDTPNTVAIYQGDNIFLQLLENVVAGDEITMDYSKNKCGGAVEKDFDYDIEDFDRCEKDEIYCEDEEVFDNSIEYRDNEMKGIVFAKHRKNKKSKYYVVVFNDQTIIHLARLEMEDGEVVSVDHEKCFTSFIDDVVNNYSVEQITVKEWH